MLLAEHALAFHGGGSVTGLPFQGKACLEVVLGKPTCDLTSSS